MNIKFTDENIMQFKPIEDTVLVKCEKFKNVTTSGILLVEKKSVIKRPDRGIVIAIGKDVSTVKPGDNIIFNNHAGYDLYENEEAYFILIQEKKIFGIIL